MACMQVRRLWLRSSRISGNLPSLMSTLWILGFEVYDLSSGLATWPALTFTALSTVRYQCFRLDLYSVSRRYAHAK
jgi:hypothetical protein